jgi:pimeloyl-ACP methyl ester carboxylesterase
VSTSASPATIVLVHGAWHGSWCWQRVLPLIQQRGYTVRTIDLPSIGADPQSAVNLSTDAATVRSRLDQIQGPIVLCGHSYGGMVLSLAAARHPAVRHLVYLCAFLPDDNQSLVDIGGGKPEPWIQVDERGNTIPDPSLTPTLFYNDCDRETQDWAARRISSMPVATFLERVPRPAWHDIESTYVVCSRDQAIPVDLQRQVLAPRATHTIELDSSHSPFFSQPQALSDLLIARAD